MLNRSEEVVSHGLGHICVPLPKNAPPTRGDAENIYSLLPLISDFIDGCLRDGETVVVHCSSGKDRSALLLSYFLMTTQDMTPGQAMRTIASLVPEAFSAEGWKPMTRRILTRHKNRQLQSRESRSQRSRRTTL